MDDFDPGAKKYPFGSKIEDFDAGAKKYPFGHKIDDFDAGAKKYLVVKDRRFRCGSQKVLFGQK